jgi:hypothetical protein
LRQKLKEYYDHEGVRDPVMVDIPRGHYHPTFRSRPPTLPGPKELDGGELRSVVDLDLTEHAASPSAQAPVDERIVKGSAKSHRWRYAGPIVLTALLLLTLVIGYFVGRHQARTAIAEGTLASEAG